MYSRFVILGSSFTIHFMGTQVEINMGTCGAAQKRTSMRTGFILELWKYFKKIKVVGMSDEELRSLTEDISKYLREETEDLQTNKQVIRMKCLFRGFTIKDWNGVDFSENEHEVCNRIVNQHWIIHYCKCWKDRNEKLHCKDIQGKRIIEWQKNEQLKALEAQYLQVIKHAMEKQLDTDACETKQFDDGHVCWEKLKEK